MSIIDIIDIVLVALLLYYLYTLIRGTHATSIITGILLIYVIWVVVRALNMELLSAILGNIVSVGIIALIVIFQPEVRRFLQGIGDQSKQHSFIGRLLGVKRKTSDTKYIAPLVEACSDMSSNKTGALIVIRQESSLNDILDTGVRIDAEISVPLLKNLFFKNSPLHDGAVVIDNNRIAAAKCVLPSTQSEVPLSFGMRHRAALGISEVCDAIVVVVSEETGGISVAHQGKIERGLSSTELQAELMRLNNAEKQSAKRV